MSEPTAFPRGKRKSTSTSESTFKKRATSSSTKEQSSIATKDKSKDDFLFGNDTIDSTIQQRSYERKQQFSSSNNIDGYNSDDSLYDGSNNNLSSKSIISSLPLGGGAVLPPTTTSTGKRIPPKIEALSFSKFQKGTKVLGCIKEIYDDYALVSLPTLLTGYIKREQFANANGGSMGEKGVELTKVLPGINTIMAFYVVGTTTEILSKRQQQLANNSNGGAPLSIKKRRIELSVYPQDVNTGLRLDEYLTPSTSSSSSNMSSSGIANGGRGATQNQPMVIRGQIKSIEDHGCLVDLGGGVLNTVSGVKQAFLKFDNIEGEYDIVESDEDEESDNEEDDKQPGDEENKKKKKKGGSYKHQLNTHRIYDFTILPSNIIHSTNTSSSSSNQQVLSSIIQLGLPTPTTLATIYTTSQMIPTLSTLLPGQLINNIHVESFAKNGLCVTFNDGLYRGCLDDDNLGGHRSGSSVESKKKDGGKKGGEGNDGMWWKHVFKGKFAKFTARIIAIDTTTKIVRFSLNPHILSLNGKHAALSFPYKVGSIIKNAKVIRVDPGIGALLALPDTTTSLTNEDDEEDKESKEIIKKKELCQELASIVDKQLSNNLLNNVEYKNVYSRVSTAYVHISKSMDPKKDEKNKKGSKQQSKNNQRTSEALFARHFSLNTTIKSLRILSTSNFIDGIASCATAPSIVNAHVLTHADITPGKIYKDVPVIQLLDSGGVLVDLGLGTKGIIPSMHLFDKASHGNIDTTDTSGYRSKIRLAKYKVGNLITVRCLTVNVNTKQCVLTAKKSLLNNDLNNPIIDYEDSIELNQVAAGFVSKVDDTGLTVTFYNNVYGRVSSRSLAAELGVEDPKMNYTVGDVVLARVVDCVRRRNRHVTCDDDTYYYQLKLSLKTIVEEDKTKKENEEANTTTPIEEGETLDKSSVSVPLAPGSILMPKRMKVLQLVKCLQRDDGVFLPGYAVVAIKSKFFTSSNSSTSGDAVECKLPYEQLLDSYGNENLSKPPVELDEIANRQLTVGKRIDAEALILSVPQGYDALPVVTLRPSLIATMKKTPSTGSNDDLSIICPTPKSNLFMNQYIQGYVTRIDSRYGAFVRFLDGLTGLIPKLKKGCDEQLYDTILCKVTALDVTTSPPKILLKKVKEGEVTKKRKEAEGTTKNKTGHSSSLSGNSGNQIQVGDIVGDVKVVDINFARAKVYLLDNQDSSIVRARIHVTMAASLPKIKTKLSKKEKLFMEEHKIGKCHPFYNWKVGDVVTDVKCVSVDIREGISYVELANLTEGPAMSSVVSDPTQLPPGSIVSSIVTSISTTPSSHHGLWVQVCPGISGFIPALELSANADELNDLQANFKVGRRIECCVMEPSSNNKKAHHRRHRMQTDEDHDDVAKQDHQALELSVLLLPNKDDDNADSSKQQAFKPTKPQRGTIVVGRINTKSARKLGPPSLMLNLRGTVVGRCCITELADIDSWENMPLGKEVVSASKSGKGQARVVSSDSDMDHENDDDASDDEVEASVGQSNDYPDGKYVKCIVLGPSKTKGTVELSMRDTRIDKEVGVDNNDSIPKPNDMVHAYVVSTTKMGCFVRLSRSVEGRVILKELSDEFIPNPSAVFPPGRLVVGKVKSVKESSSKKGGRPAVTMVDMDMRESVLLSSADRISLDDVKVNSKYTGVITRVESYGVFVRIDNSDVSGLAHVSKCSDSYIKNIFDLYNPGDFVKLVVIQMDKEQSRLAFSLKASNFDDSDDDSSSSSSSDDEESNAMEVDSDGEGDDDAIDSDDENFAAKLAKKMEADGDDEEDKMEVDNEDEDSDDDSSSGSSSDSDSESSDSEDDDEEENPKVKAKIKSSSSSMAMDTNVGFDWGSTAKPTKSSKSADSSDDSDDSSSSSEEESDNEDADADVKSSHKSRKKAAAKRREEEETSRRESALADGTADETPETSADFERLVASSPNSSEVWIKYMAFHLSLADMDSARKVANRAFERIEFRQEGEKLNVWTALLTLELKYGTDKTLSETVDRACQQNNPKQVYLRVCELLDKEVDAATSASGSTDVDTATKRADEMFKKMCKKFKSKKQVWIAHFQYLLKGSRHEEAHALLKRSLQSLPEYKHVEVMQKFAQMEFELGSPERGRTIFNALLEKHPKRMDLLFVNIDKEVKNGDIAKARALFDSVVNPVNHDRKFKFSDKQMKSLFKKWYRMEDEHGDEDSQERVKEEARKFVSKDK